jgi:hypothetical protein
MARYDRPDRFRQTHKNERIPGFGGRTESALETFNEAFSIEEYQTALFLNRFTDLCILQGPFGEYVQGRIAADRLTTRLISPHNITRYSKEFKEVGISVTAVPDAKNQKYVRLLIPPGELANFFDHAAEMDLAGKFSRLAHSRLTAEQSSGIAETTKGNFTDAMRLTSDTLRKWAEDVRARITQQQTALQNKAAEPA